MRLDGRVAVIAGGAGYLGSTLADALGEVGATVVLLDCDSDRCESVAAELQQRGRQAVAYPCDLSDEAAVAAAPLAIAAEQGSLDILVYCAALVGTSPLPGWTTDFEEQSAETWRRALEVNLTAAFVLIQAATPALRQSGHSSIINILSHSVLVGPDLSIYDDTKMGMPAAYVASKGGLLTFSRYLAATLAPDIRVNTITPGGIWRNHQQVFYDRYVAKAPLGRMAREEDFKGAAVYLASDQSAYMTGNNLVIDGGFTVW